MAVDPSDYREPGPFTSVDPEQLPLIDDLPDDPVEICALIPGLVVAPDDAVAAGVPEHRRAERDVRPVRDLIGILAALDPAPLGRGHGRPRSGWSAPAATSRP